MGDTINCCQLHLARHSVRLCFKHCICLLCQFRPVHFYAGWTIFFTLFAFVTRRASLIRNTKIKYKSNLSTAIGIRHTKIKQIAQGAMGGSFNTREYFHGAKPLFFKSIKWIFLILVFVLPILLLSSALTTDLFALFAIAFTARF